MVIKTIHIDDFGVQHAREHTLTTGLNILEGENESGKTTIVAFLTYLFYGILPSFAKEFAAASGWVDVVCRDPGHAGFRTYRVVRSRTHGKEEDSFRAVYTVSDGVCDETNLLRDGEEPGMFFFGVTAGVFGASALVTQVSASERGENARDTHPLGDGSKLSGDAVRAAMERILYAADEELDPQHVVDVIGSRKKALYDPETGHGSIAELEKRRDALAAAVEAQEHELAAAAEAAAQNPATDEPEAREALAAMPEQEPETAAVPKPEDTEVIRLLDASIHDYEEKKRAREARNTRLGALYDAYRTYTELKQTGEGDIRTLCESEEAARSRAEGLSASMFRGDYVPDRAYVKTLHAYASEIAAADREIADTAAKQKQLDFSVRRDNLKENQLRRVLLDGGVNVVFEKFQKLCSRRMSVTVFGVLFLFFAVLMLAATVVFLLLHNDAMKDMVLITAILGALSGFFFFYRIRFQKSINVMLARYSCATEDELENFLEEYVLSEGKLQSLDENKDALTQQKAQASLHAGEAARQAALALSKLQPPGSARIASDRLTAEVIEKAAQRIDRALDEIEKQNAIAAAAGTQISAILTKFGAADVQALDALRESLAAQFEGTGSDGTPLFDEEQVLREMDFNMKSCAAIETKLSVLHKKRAVLLQTVEDARVRENTATVHASDKRSEAAALPRSVSAANCLPDSALLKSLLTEMDAGLRRARRSYAALALSGSEMRKASAALHAEIAPRLLCEAGHTLGFLTAERFGVLSLDDTMTLTAAGTASASEPLKLDYLSAGTQELAYLSLRMALIVMLYGKELPPLIFDEAFATLDDKRLARMIALLLRKTEADHEQALVFTCHKRERKAAEVLGGCNIIRL